MKIQIVNKTDSEVKFTVDGIQFPFANELRRVMMGEIPTMSIEYVDFVKNDSVLNDELLANRLGQIPLKFDRKAYNLPKECKCKGKGCSLCQVKMTLKKKGPGMVYASDLKSKSKDVVPVFDKTPIVELFDSQQVEFEATTTLGVGKEHSKWQGAVAGYSSLFETMSKSGVKLCDNHLFHVKDVKGTKVQPIDCALCQSLNKDGNGFKPLNDSFLFTVESASGLAVGDIVSDSAGILEDKMKEFEKALKKLK